MKVIKGDLIKLSLQGEFDIIGHGCNCFCTQKAGIAKQMSKVFYTNDPRFYPVEDLKYKGFIGKLGNIVIPSTLYHVENNLYLPTKKNDLDKHYLRVCNMYTQFYPGKNLNYAALELCFYKLQFLANRISIDEEKEVKVGLPWIGCGIAGGSKKIVKDLMEKTMKDVNLTVVQL